MKLIKSALVLGLVVSSAAMAQLSETESPLAKAYAAKNDGGFDHAGLVMARQQSSGPDAREVLARTGLGPRDVNLGYERDSGRGLDRFGFRSDRGGFGSRMDRDFGSERGDHKGLAGYGYSNQGHDFGSRFDVDHAGLVMARQQSSGPDAREVLARTGLGPRDVNLGYERDSGRGLDRGSFGSEREFRLDRGGFGSRMDPDFGSERGDHRRAPAYFVK